MKIHIIIFYQNYQIIIKTNNIMIKVLFNLAILLINVIMLQHKQIITMRTTKFNITGLLHKMIESILVDQAVFINKSK